MEKSFWLMIMLTTLVLFFFSSLIHTNDVCCMFASTRSYGFPGRYIVVSKETDLLEEAKKVETLSTTELLSRGWEMHVGTGTNSGVSQSAAINLGVNIFLCFIVSFLGVSLIKRLSSSTT